MKTEGYVDRSLDDFIKANRGMFRRGRGRAGGRGAASTRGGRGRGRGRGQSRGGSRGRSTSRGSARGSARGSSRGRGGARGAGRGQRGAARAARGASFGQRWRASSARMGSHMEAAAPATPVKRRQLAVKAVRGSKLAGRLGTPGKGVKRLTTLALQKKRQALQQLTNGKQLSRKDARNEILMKRRGLTTATTSSPRRGRGASRGASRSVTRGASRAESRAALRASAAPLRRPERQLYDLQEPVPTATRRPLRRPLNRTRITPGSAVTAPAGDSLLTVQFKNDIAVRPRRAPPPPQYEMEMDDDMPLPPSPPPPPPPPPARSRGGLDPRIQQEIAAIQARGRSQHHLPAAGRSSGVSNFRPTAAASSRTLNDRFTAERLIFS